MDPKQGTVGRRDLLKVAAAVGASAVLGGCGMIDERPGNDSPLESAGTADAQEIPGADDYGTVVDLVEEGADDSGEESILPLLEEHADDDTLLYLREGVYMMDRTFEDVGISEFGITGDGAIIRPPEGYSGTLISLVSDDGLRVRGVDFDFTAESNGGRVLQLTAGDDLEVVDVAVAGPVDVGPGVVRVDVTESDGSGLVENLSLPDGGVAGSGASGVYVGQASQGDITFRDCTIEGFPDNGLYADPPAGEIHVEGGYYANNGISNIRVRSGSTVRGAHVRCDSDHDSEFRNLRGIRASDYEPQPDADPVVIEDCNIEMLAVTHSDGGITLSSQLGELVVRDTHITIDADNVEGIWAKTPHPDLEDGDSPPRVRCENVSVTGSAADGAAIRIDARHGCSLANLYILQPGANRDGLQFRRSNGNVVTDSILDVGASAVRLSESTADLKRTISAPPPF